MHVVEGVAKVRENLRCSQVQWGSEIQTSLDFEWSKRGWVANGLDFVWSGFQMVGTIAIA